VTGLAGRRHITYGRKITLNALGAMAGAIKNGRVPGWIFDSTP
jgi:hypothetical protein